MKKALLLILFLSTAIGVAGCRRDQEDTPDPIPTISNPSNIFMELDGIEITNEMLYKHMKASEGITHLINYVDFIILSDIIDNFDSERLENERLRMKYGTTDQETIDRIRADEEQYAEVEKNYYHNMIFAGFNPENQAEVERFVALTLAQRDITIDRSIENYDPEHLHSLARNRYQSTKQGDVTAIELIFRSNQEFTAIMHKFNLVPDYQNGIGEYFGETPIENLRRADFSSNNTRLLDETEVFEAFVEIYNYLFPYRDAIDASMTLDHLEAFASDEFRFNYDAMTNQPALERVANILFNELDIEDNRYTIESRRYHLSAPHLEGYRAMYFLLDQDEVTPFDELPSDEQDSYKRDYVESTINQQTQIRAMVEQRTEANFVIHDRILHFTYEEMIRQVFPDLIGEHAKYERADEGIIATIGDETVTTDDFFAYMLRRIGAVNVVELYKELWLLESDYFVEVYGEERNLNESDHPSIQEYRNIIRDFKEQAAADMSFEQALQMIGFADEDAVLRFLVVGELLNYLVVPNLDFDRALEHVQKIYDNYINLNVEHILIYLDMDGDLSPDDFKTFLEDLEAQGGIPWATYLDHVASLESLIATRLNQGYTMQEVVTEYRNASRDESSNPWAVFKNYGFKLRYEDLSPGNNVINATTVQRFVTPFRDRLYELYALYKTEAYEDAESILDPSGVFATDFGLHFVRVSKGNEAAFLPPSAAFEDPEGDYDERWLNKHDVPTEAQLRLWAEHAFKRSFTIEGSDIEIDEDLDEVLRIYFDQFLGRHFPLPQEEFDPFGNTIMINRFIENDVTFSIENDHLKSMMHALLDLYESIMYD